MQISLLANMMPGLATRIRKQLREDKVRIRSAVYTMAVICTTHLVCNSLHLSLSGSCARWRANALSYALCRCCSARVVAVVAGAEEEVRARARVDRLVHGRQRRH